MSRFCFRRQSLISLYGFTYPSWNLGLSREYGCFMPVSASKIFL